MSEVFSWGLGVAVCLLIRRLLLALGPEKETKQMLAFLSAAFLIILLAAPLPKAVQGLSDLLAGESEIPSQSRVVNDAAKGLEAALAHRLMQVYRQENFAVSSAEVAVEIGQSGGL